MESAKLQEMTAAMHSALVCAQYDRVEQIICRAAAGTLGLTPENIETAAEKMEGLIYEVSDGPTAEEERILLALRHFAELTRDE